MSKEFRNNIKKLRTEIDNADAIVIGAGAYSDFLRRHESLHVLYLELGVGSNTPVIIKYPFWQITASNLKAVYACLNYGEAYCPIDIENQSICIDGDIDEILDMLK